MLKNILATIILLVLDFLWLGLFMGGKYTPLVKAIQGSELKMNPYSAAAAYLLMVVALNMFVIKYNFTYLETFIFGVCLYGVYDFTNGAIFGKWDFNLAIIDILWGGLVYLLAHYLSDYLIKNVSL